MGEYVDTAGRLHGFLLDQDVYTSIDVPGGASTVALDINDGGQIVGVTATELNDHGFVQDSQGVNTIDAPHAIGGTQVYDIDDGGQVAGAYHIVSHGYGYYADVNGDFHGFLLDDDSFITIDVPGALLTQAFDIDNHGRIAGGYTDAAGTPHGFLRDSSGALTVIDVPGAAGASITGSNDRGQVVGIAVNADGTTNGFLLDNGVISVIDPPNAVETVPFDINNRGQIVGGNADDVRRHGFLLSHGRFTTLRAPAGKFLDSIALGPNDLGQIVGIRF